MTVGPRATVAQAETSLLRQPSSSADAFGANAKISLKTGIRNVLGFLAGDLELGKLHLQRSPTVPKTGAPRPYRIEPKARRAELAGVCLIRCRCSSDQAHLLSLSLPGRNGWTMGSVYAVRQVWVCTCLRIEDQHPAIVSRIDESRTESAPIGFIEAPV